MVGSFALFLLLFFLVCGEYIFNYVCGCVCVRVKSLVCRQQVGVCVLCIEREPQTIFETMTWVVVVVFVAVYLFARLNVSQCGVINFIKQVLNTHTHTPMTKLFQ